MILGLALVPSKSFQDEVNAYRKRYDNHYAQIMPHITIKPQFEIDDHDFNLIKDEVKNRISSIKPVEVHATKASNFAPISNVIYFKVAKTEPLEQLFNQFNTEDFTVLLNILLYLILQLQGLTSQEFEDIYGQVKLAGVDHREIIEELSLLNIVKKKTNGLLLKLLHWDKKSKIVK